MREIKFRGKNKKGNWHYGMLTYVNFNQGVEKAIAVKMEFGSIFIEKIDKNTIGQYTGLKDKNGVEIYEGDIIKRTVISDGFGSFISVVDYKHGGFVLKEEYGYCPFYDIFNSVYEVIGNIYDNPELIKE